MRNIEVDVSFDEMFQELAEAGFDIAISAKTSSSKTGTIKMAFAPEYEEEAECIAECLCEAQEETPNPFILQHKQKRADLAKLGLSELIYWEQDKVKREAEQHIKENGIIDEDEKCKVHHMMRDHYLAYKEYLKNNEQ
jgi:hypothetical protein